MLKFFRRIRQNLLNEGKFKRYLIYAIGEILLVIVGILLALQINNKNSERIEKEEFKRILQYVLEDLEKDKSDFLAITKNRKKNVDRAEFLLKTVKEGNTLNTEEIFENSLVIYVEYFHRNESGFERLLSNKLYESEDFFEAREKIRSYIDFVTRYNDREQGHLNFVAEMKVESAKKGSHLELMELIKLGIRNRSLSDNQKTDINEFKIDFEKNVTNNPPMLAILLRGIITYEILEDLSSIAIEKGEEIKVEIGDYLNK